MFRDRRFAAIHYDHGTANPTTITSDIHCPMVMVNIDADKRADPPRSSQATKVMHKARGKPGKTDNCPIDLYHESTRSIHFRPRCLADV